MSKRFLSFSQCLLVGILISAFLTPGLHAQEDSSSKPAVCTEEKCAGEECAGEKCNVECDGKCAGECDNCQSCDQKETVSTAVATKKALAEKDKKATKEVLKNSHKQNGVLVPKHDGKAVGLSTFRIRPDGNIVACVTPTSKIEEGVAGFVQIYDSAFELVNEYPLPFAPTALDLDASGNIYVAGSGTVARLDREGEIELTRNSPNLDDADMEELRKEIEESLKEEREQMAGFYSKQIDTLKKQIEEIEETDEEERTLTQKSKFKVLKTQLDTYENVIKQQLEVNDAVVDQRLKMGSRVTALAVADQDVFMATSARTGSGYEVYRLNHELSEPKRVLKKLSGCCGQMDIHAKGDKIYVAENTKFQVGIYDREGKQVSSFGERLRKKNQGFGSCCNPMNVMCCNNGDILTAESSIGKLKRFSAEGDLIGYIGRARIGGGCKHVAFGHDENLDRYYVQYEDKNHICVLDPNASISEKVDPKIAAMSERLTRGEWQLVLVAEKKELVSSEDVHEGIGVMLEKNGEGKIVVKEVISGSPAAEKRIGVGDEILNIGDVGGTRQSTEDMEAEEVAANLQGKPGKGVRLRLVSAESGKKRRLTIRRARMELVDDEWQVTESGNQFAFDASTITDMKILDFAKDGSFNFKMQSPDAMLMGDSSGGQKWIPTKVANDTLHLDIESGADDMITYRIKARFDGDDKAQISVTYDGFGEVGEFREFKLKENSESAENSDATED